MSNDQENTFLLTDLDYKIKETDTSPTIRLFGKTREKSVQVRITDFYPYFYVTKKKGLYEFIEKNDRLKNWLHKTEEAKGKRYFGGEELKLVKVFGTHPEQTPTIRQIFINAGYEIHEADIPFLKRFLLDLKIRSLNVINVKCQNCVEKEDTISADASYLDINSVSIIESSSTDYFYKLKIMAFDIEVDHQTETIQQLIGYKNKRVTAISYVWGQMQNDKNKKIFLLEEDSDSAERQLFHDFLKAINKIQPDMLVTFNGDNFDFPYLLERMNRLGISNKLFSLFGNDDTFYSTNHRSYRIKGRISYDLSPRTWRIHPISGKKGLGDIAETVLGRKKVDITRNTGVIWRSGFLEGNNKDKKLLEKYALMDSILTYDLFWKLGMPGWLEVIKLTGYPPGEAPGATERIHGEFELMRFCKLQGILIPMTPNNDEIKRRSDDRRKNPHVGGTVLVPKGTLHLGVIISDFRSMYPSVCVAHNIGGEVLKKVKDIQSANPLELFHSKPQSCLSLMEETLIRRRGQTKSALKELDSTIEKTKNEKTREQLLEDRAILDKEQYSLKIVANSMYGAHNYILSRFYSITLGNAITNIARTYILRMEDLLKDVSKKVTPCEIIYGDTDSAFIKILDSSLTVAVFNEKNPKRKQENLERLMKVVMNIIKELNAKFPEAMELVFEDFAYKLIFKPGRAKAYSLYSLLTNKLKITGFEAVRSDWSFLSRDAQRDILEIILKAPYQPSDNKQEDSGLIKAKNYLIELGIKILQMPKEDLISKTVILSPIKKEPSKYKAKVPVVQAFLDYAEKEKLDPTKTWKDFDKFQWVVIPGKGLISDRARHPKYAPDVDRDHYITEILRSSEGFGVRLTLQDVKNKLEMEPIDEIFKRIPKQKQTINQNEKDVVITEKSVKRTKQTKLQKFLSDD